MSAKVIPPQNAPAASVTVIALPASELASKIAKSAVVGTDAPEVPPDVVDHFVVDPHVPEPPTQYLLAIVNLQ
jgi:hypothetical protein